LELEMIRIRKVVAARLLFSFLTAFTLLIAGGCSSLKVLETWQKPAVQAHRYQKILILGIARDENKRALFENLVVDELRLQQVTAVPGNAVIPFLNMDNTTRAAIVAAVKKSGCDAVLTTRAMAVGSTTVTQGGDGAYVYGANIRSSHYDFLRATLQTSLYDVATEELLWSSTVSSSDAHEVPRVSRELGQYFFKSLRHSGLI
jgi:hypothetical protein